MVRRIARCGCNRWWLSTAWVMAICAAGCDAGDDPAEEDPSGLEVQAQVVDQDGVGLGGLKVSFSPSSGTSGSTAGATTSTGPRGTFSVKLEAGAYQLQVLLQKAVVLDRSVSISDTGLLSLGKVIQVKLPSGRGTPKFGGVAPPAPLHVVPSVPYGGQQVVINAAAKGATSIGLTAKGAGCGTIKGYFALGSTLSYAATVGQMGQCQLRATVVRQGKTEQLVSSFLVQPPVVKLPGVKVLGGAYVPTALTDQATLPGTPTITGISAPSTLINGGVVKVQLALGDSSQLNAVKNVRVAFEKSQGHFVVPAKVEQGKIVFFLRADRDFFASGGSGTALMSGGGLVTMFVQLQNHLGHLSKRFSQLFSTTKVGTGDVQVSLSWDTATDVDLHVVDPLGEEIYYKSKKSISGGVLDLDSNAGCNIDNINNENITWPKGKAPKGTYKVLVDFYEACSNLGAKYTVTTNVCGKTRTYNGQFTASQADKGGKGYGVLVTSFDTKCSYRASGRATYEDFAQTTKGLSSTATKLPIRHARVEARRASDDKTLASGQTDANGKFDLEFQNTGKHGYYVLVQASAAGQHVRQQVVNDKGEIYARRSKGTIDEQQNPDRTGIEIHAPRDQAGPAFNIFDVGLTAATLVRRMNGETPTMLSWLWTSGKGGLCGELAASCYCHGSCKGSKTPTISVLSIKEDADEYDDLVLLHEYGHFYQRHYSRSDSPGLTHTLDKGYDPRLAWGEGSATFFGNHARETSLYLDTNAAGIYVSYDLDSLPGYVPSGTDNNKIDGLLSEGRVAGIMWDLADSTNESKDTLSNPVAVFSAMAYLKSSHYKDRGHKDADLTDFLDGWFCKGHGDRGDKTKGVEGIVSGIHAFPYDFAKVKSCVQK